MVSDTREKPADPSAPIELFFWPTPNGFKIAMMLEECALPYAVRFINIARGDQFAPEFLAIAPNNRIPAIVDPDGPGGAPISVFESGAILTYLARKTGLFLPEDPRERVEVEQWLYWQVGGLGPMAGQAHHFRIYASEKVPYAIQRYTDEVNRLYGVMDRRLAALPYLAGTEISVADIAAYPWVRSHERQGQDLAAFPDLKAWFERIAARPATRAAYEIGTAERAAFDIAKDAAAKDVLFGQRA
ncbi:MAG: glutathione binding-like protein [Pseudomonadota bacterium]